MENPNSEAAKEFVEQQIRQGFEDIKALGRGLKKQQSDGDRALRFLEYIARNYSGAILILREMFLQSNMDGVYVGQELRTGEAIIPAPLAILEEEDEFNLGLKRAYAESDPKESVVLGVVTESFDWAIGIVNIKELEHVAEQIRIGSDSSKN